jgi:predicted nucleic acid-binding protein
LILAMILVDTSVWIGHLRETDTRLQHALLEGEVVGHPFVIGELACGNLTNRAEILTLLKTLPVAPQVDFDEYLFFIDEHQLQGRGIGFADVHLLASAALGQAKLWTKDKRLNSAAVDLDLDYRF